MRFLILNADTPTGFYLINRLILRGENIDAIIIGDGDGDNFIHPDINYFNPTQIKLHTFKSNNYDAIFYIGDTHRLYTDFVDVIHSLFYFDTPIIAIFDWEMFNGVKRGNFPVSTATSTSPDNFRGISKVWIKDTLLRAAKINKIPVSIMVTPSVLSPFHFLDTIRNGAEYYLAQKLWDVFENYKTGKLTEINKGDLKVIYDIVHNTDVAQAAIDLFDNKTTGYYMLSSNIYLRFSEILETFFGRLVQSEPIKLKKLPITIINKRRTLANYDTTIDMVELWSNAVYNTEYPLDAIFDDIIYTTLSVDKDYELIEKIMMHLIL